MPKVYFKIQKKKSKKAKEKKISTVLKVDRLLSVGMELHRTALKGGFAGWVGVGWGGGDGKTFLEGETA